MSVARLKVTFAGPLVTLQDGGRPGHLRFGVPASGPMDRFAHIAAHAMLGQAADETAIEVSLGGLALECVEGEMTVAVAGGQFQVTSGKTTTAGWGVHVLRQNEKLSVRTGAWGSFAYIAVSGSIDARHWLGHTATHLRSGLGGGAVKTGDVLTIAKPSIREDRIGAVACPDLAEPLARIRIVLGPQDDRFETEALDRLKTAPFRLTSAFDRMGVRLDGLPLKPADSLSIPSEPIIRGAIQVAGDGVPTILLADHQTTGGYPKIATVLSSDIDRLAQCRAGDEVRFTPVKPEMAIDIVRDHHRKVGACLDELSAPRLTLGNRLMRMNLIDGVTSGRDNEVDRSG